MQQEHSVPVAIVACPDYELGRVSAALEELVKRLGGWPSFLRPGSRVFVKTNLIMAAPPEAAVTTHPALVEAVVRALQAGGMSVVLGDCPGGLFRPAALRHIYQVCGMTELARRTGCELNMDFRELELSLNGRRISVSRPMAEADAMVNLAKLKTHGMMGYTAAVKNLFGVVPGLVKAEYHMALPQQQDFAGLLCDLADWAKPVLSVVDAVEAMEGEGPSHGQPRHLGALLASRSPYAADAVAIRLMGLEEASAPVLACARKRGCLPEPEILGELEPFLGPPFLMPKSIEADLGRWALQRLHLQGLLPENFQRWVCRSLAPIPRFLPERCKRCGACVRNCPAAALRLPAEGDKSKVPHLEPLKCIHCFCCQELCPFDAVGTRHPRLLRLLDHIQK